MDMLCHWRYVLDNLFGRVEAVSCLAATHIPRRWNEAGHPYEATADDAPCNVRARGGIVAPLHSSWCVRVRPRRPADAAGGWHAASAVAGCVMRFNLTAPRRGRSGPRYRKPTRFFQGWQKVPDQDTFDNAFKRQWELSCATCEG